MISLRDGIRLIPLGDNKSSVEVGSLEQMVSSLETLRDAVIAGELDQQLETLISNKKPFPKRKDKQLPRQCEDGAMGLAIILMISFLIFFVFFTILRDWLTIIFILLSNEYVLKIALVIAGVTTLIWI